MAEAENITISGYLAQRLGLTEAQRDAWQQLFALLMAQLEAGHTLLENNTQCRALLKQLPNSLISTPIQARKGEPTPTVAEKNYLGLHRHWQAEQDIVNWIMTQLNKTTRAVISDDIEPFLQGLKRKQTQAVRHALSHALTIINGGPGTGKTYTIAKLIQALLTLSSGAHIKLAAPTGKAANRMEMALQQALPETIIAQLPSAKTIHSLLGIVPGKGAKYDQSLPLDVDVLIIDEASMLSLELMQQLINALPDHAQLILIGDANQLAAVEPGAVLHDMTRASKLSSAVVTLTESARFAQDSVVGQLADAVLTGDEGRVLATLADTKHDWQQGQFTSRAHAQRVFDDLFAGYVPYLAQLQSGEMEQIFRAFDAYRILCAGHAGNLGSELINTMMRQRHLAHLSLRESFEFYHGQPLMVLSNQPNLKLYNGDIGLCLMNEQQQPALYFPNQSNPIAIDNINRQHITNAYAFSIHKSQGSEYDKVAICLDRAQQRLMSRELLYTAITRAKSTVALYADTALITQAIQTPTKRLTGINIQLAADSR